MFARTKRLTLRPGWPEDAAALTQAVAYESVAMKLASLPWPYHETHAAEWLAMPRAASEIVCLILAHETGGARLVGAIGIHPQDGSHELGYWLTPDAWGRGYATEAGRAMLHMARHALGLKRLTSGHFIDNPASGRVLDKLCFRPTGRVVQRHSLARGLEQPCALYELNLVRQGGGDCEHLPIAA